MISALVLGTLLSQERTVTFTHPCAHSSVVLEAFGKEIGETIKPSGSVNKDYFLVVFDDMPVEDAKEAIAKGLNATWMESEGVTYLTRTHKQELADETQFEETLDEAIRRTVNEAKAKLASFKPYTFDGLIAEKQKEKDGDRNSFMSYERGPLSRFQTRVSATMDVRFLSDLPEGTIYFTTDPELDHLPFPKAWSDALQLYREEAELWDRASEAVSPGDQDSSFRNLDSGVIDSCQIGIDKSSSVVAYSLQMTSGRAGMSTGLEDVRREWKFNGSSWHGFYEPAKFGADVPDELKGVWKERENGFGMRGMWFPRSRDRGELPQVLQSIYDDLVTNEPLAKLVSWPILTVAEKTGVNIVALLPDSMLSWPFGSSVSEGTQMPMVFSTFYGLIVGEFDKDRGCWLVRPLFPAQTRRARTDRTEFARFAKKVDKQKWIRLDDMAGYIRATGRRTFEKGWDDLLSESQFTTPGFPMFPMFAQNTHRATQIYSMLNSAQRRAAWSGGVELPVRSWSSKLLRLMNDVDWDSKKFVLPGAELNQYERPKGRLAEIVFRERLPAGTVMRVRVETTMGVFTSTDGKSGRATDLASYALQAQEDSPYKTNPESVTFGAAPSEQLTVEVFVPRAGTFALNESFQRVPFIDEFRKLDDLTGQFKQQIVSALKKSRGGI